MSNGSNSSSLDSDRSEKEFGDVIYTISVIVFYSLSSFFLLVLTIRKNDYFHEKTFSDFSNEHSRETCRRSEQRILDELSNPSIRIRYWKIYYGENYISRLKKSASSEFRTINLITKRKRALNSGTQQQTDQEQNSGTNPLNIRHVSFELPNDSTSSKIMSKRRKCRSTSTPAVPKIFQDRPTRRLDKLSEIP